MTQKPLPVSESLTLYGLKNCTTVRKALAWLKERGLTCRFHEWRQDGAPETLLASLAENLVSQGESRDRLLNRSSATYRALSEADKAALAPGAPDAWQKALALMSRQPALIKRPLLVVKGSPGGARSLLGFSLETYEAFFNGRARETP